jgi:trk system potassium uptake protein
MHIAMIFRILGLLLMLFSISLLPPIVVSLMYEDEATGAFIDSLFFNFILGFACWLPVRRERQELRCSGVY